MPRLGPGPVFYLEWLTLSRRWQTYAGRSAFVAFLLVSLTVVWWTKGEYRPGAANIRTMAGVGETIFYAIVGTQLSLVLLAAPAYTAGSVCLDRARGNLTHMFTTDLSGAEIVLGKLFSRLCPVLGLVFISLPILALATFFGGIVPESLFGAFLVTVGVAVLGCTLTLSLSVWGNKPHEVLLGTYVIWTIWLLALPAYELVNTQLMKGPPPDAFVYSNPYWLAFGPYFIPGGVEFQNYFIFLGICLGLSLLLTLLAILTLRRAVVRHSGKPQRRGRRWMEWKFLPQFGPSLDLNPVLWREWHRRTPSRWMRLVWVVYGGLAIIGTLVSLLFDSRSGRHFAPFVNAFQFSIGLLLVSVTSVTSLFEERVRGSLDVLLTTPLKTSSIVWGKWWGSFRGLVLLIVLPTCLALWHGLPNRGWNLINLFLNLSLLVGMMLAYGVAVTSLGLALATWVRRFGLAVGLNVVTYALLTVGPILLYLTLGFHAGRDLEGFVCGSPWYGVGELTYELGSLETNRHVVAQILWVFGYALSGLVLVFATVRTFDRCLGRVSNQLPGFRPFRQPRATAGP